MRQTLEWADLLYYVVSRGSEVRRSLFSIFRCSRY